MAFDYLQVGGSWMFARLSEIDSKRRTVVFLHGLGDSSASFVEAFERPELRDFNLVAPDLLGFGRSSAAVDGHYSFEAQAERIWRLLDELKLGRVDLVGHSMGGDLATLMAQRSEERIDAVVNVEGNLAVEDLIISRDSVAADERGELASWLYGPFSVKVRETWGNRWPSCRRYFESLVSCRLEAFRESARELVRRNAQIAESGLSETGRQFANLAQPSVFCWGSHVPLDLSRREGFLGGLGIRHRPFEQAFHWVMIDRSDEFYPFVRDFLDSAPYRSTQ